jgi:hypothetical protein
MQRGNVKIDNRRLLNALLYIAENGYCESFNSKLRDELLNGEIFYTLAEARTIIESWRQHYNRASEHPSVYVIEGKRLC